MITLLEYLYLNALLQVYEFNSVYTDLLNMACPYSITDLLLVFTCT